MALLVSLHFIVDIESHRLRCGIQMLGFDIGTQTNFGASEPRAGSTLDTAVESTYRRHSVIVDSIPGPGRVHGISHSKNPSCNGRDDFEISVIVDRLFPAESVSNRVQVDKNAPGVDRLLC